MPRRYSTPDANEKPIVDALRAHGIKVHRIEGRPGSPGVLDLLAEARDVELDQAADILGELALYRELVAAGIDKQVHQVYAMLRRRATAHWILVEIKNSKTKTQTKHVKASELAVHAKYAGVLAYCDRHTARLLKRTQGDFLVNHTAPMHVVTTIAEALEACGVELMRGECGAPE